MFLTMFTQGHLGIDPGILKKFLMEGGGEEIRHHADSLVYFTPNASVQFLEDVVTLSSRMTWKLALSVCFLSLDVPDLDVFSSNASAYLCESTLSTFLLSFFFLSQESDPQGEEMLRCVLLFM